MACDKQEAGTLGRMCFFFVGFYFSGTSIALINVYFNNGTILAVGIIYIRISQPKSAFSYVFT